MPEPRMTPTRRLPWIARGDINGFFGLVVDNLSILGFLATALIGIFGFPAEVVFGRMFPGTALGVLVGNLIYTAMARSLARRTGRDDVTAMPLGLDAPTTIGLALLVLGPSFVAFRQGGMDEDAAALATWQLGMAAMIAMGVLKLVSSFFGGFVQRLVPRAGLLGSIAGIALMLMGFLPLVEAMRVPVVGFVTLGLLLYALVAKGPVPFRMPGVLFAFLVGIALYYGFGAAGWLGTGYRAASPPSWHVALPWPTLDFIAGLPHLWPYLPLVLPFGLLMVVGGINVTESARAAGDDYRTRDILLTEAVSTLVAGLCGGVAQTTPYIGQPAYKHMGARQGYTLLTGLFIGLGGILGYVSGLVELLPLAVLAPIIIYVAIDITVQAFDATPRRHAPAVVFAFLPAIAYLMTIKLGNPGIVPPDQFARLLADASHGLPELATTVMLGNGFIITSMLWATALVAMIEQRPGRAALTLGIAAVLTAFGVIHSVQAQGGMYLPWQLEPAQAFAMRSFALAYVLAAVALLLLAVLARGEKGTAAAAD
jgi:AGZA family xanthine/uracil permease-like MFS transporter